MPGAIGFSRGPDEPLSDVKKLALVEKGAEREFEPPTIRKQMVVKFFQPDYSF
jgi:hypothetical protein